MVIKSDPTAPSKRALERALKEVVEDYDYFDNLPPELRAVIRESIAPPTSRNVMSWWHIKKQQGYSPRAAATLLERKLKRLKRGFTR